MKNIVLFGPPGSGKGTQAASIIAKYNLIHLSTGDMLRAEIAGQTKLGLEAKSLMDKGELVPDAVVVGMIDNKLKANPNAAGFVFDGFPRTVAQASALDTLLANKNAPIQKVLSLKVSEEELTKRILDRGKTSGRPDDQNEEIVKNRVTEYRTKTEPLAAYYAKQGKLVEIQGEGTVDHISDLLNYEIDNISDARPSNGGSTGGLKKEEDKVPFPIKEVKNEEPKKIAAPKPVAKKEVKKAPAKKAEPKKAAKKAAPKKAVKKAAPKKAVKKAAPKKAVKKAAPKKVAKKAAKKAVKKAAPKKTIKKAAPKKAVKKAAKKAAPNKVAKKAVKKAAPKKSVKKAVKKVAKKAPKKATKKVVKKVVKKAAPKKVVKKAAKKAAKKAVKSYAKKVAPKRAVKKAVKKPAAKKTVKKPVAKKTAKKAAVKKKKK